MIRTYTFLKKNLYNAKLNREKFIMNKKKINEKKNFCTKVPDPDPDPDPDQDPFPDWWFTFIIAVTAYSVGKINGTKKR